MKTWIQAAKQQDWPLFVSTGTTILKLIHPICLNCTDLAVDYMALLSNFT
jgi:hypothetical protein